MNKKEKDFIGILLMRNNACKCPIYNKPLNLAKNYLTFRRFFDVMTVDRTHICIDRGEELARDRQDVPNFDAVVPQSMLKLERACWWEGKRLEYATEKKCEVDIHVSAYEALYAVRGS